ncbi:ferritin-like domain-containing protein [Streptomyces sp. J2-1]|uniref:ferritin-like domain-containing protein n=1 Tax=Streptomyces corallincola TaxID=2851888 RepID=UPI001C381D24|nr:ferritin-like domain-containing protein [Streptomyces corallincola]MBV2355694.1 ferritin-like domain-containing protein [Streptomyces corallincola]
MTTVGPPAPGTTRLDLGTLGFEQGAHLLLARALRGTPRGAAVEVAGTDPALLPHLTAWCRHEGHEVRAAGTGSRDAGRGADTGGAPVVAYVRPGALADARLSGAARAGGPEPERMAERAPLHWGLAARGALVEAGGPDVPFAVVDRDVAWTDLAPRLYRQATAGQWDPYTAVDWDEPFTLPDEIEAAVVQVMTYLVENEQAALVVPGRLLVQVHPHFREVLQLLAVQAADEARHVEVFTRRALLTGGGMGTSSAGGRASLATLLTEPDFSIASFLLSVLGEGSFLNLLSFLERHAPDPVTRRISHLVRQDEARHVAFGVGHLEHRAGVDPRLHGRLRAAVERRHDALIGTAGLNRDVFDSLVLLAAGSWAPEDIRRGWQAVARLQTDMDDGRRHRLSRLGFPDDEAAELSALHTRNFM